MTNDALDYLMGGAPTCNFLTLGTVRKGRIRTYEKTQQRDMETGTPETWDDGSPKWQIVLTLETDERDPEIDGDDGVRRLFAKAQMLSAIRDAIRKSGHRGDVTGGMLAVKYHEDGQAKTRGFNPPKIYKAQFTPPIPTDETDDFANVGDPAQNRYPDDGVSATEYDPGEEPF